MKARRPSRLDSRKVLGLASVLLALVLAPATGKVRAESPSFKVYTTEEGLAHDFVRKIVRDSRGFLWFCTSEGLSRFDGSRFTNFTTDQGLPHRNINTVFETRNGTYLIGTSLGIAVFNPNGAPYRWNVPEQRLEQTSDEPPMFRTFAPIAEYRQSKIIYSLAETDDGTIWVATALGLYRTRLADELIFEKVEVEPGVQTGFYDLLDDREGGVITVTSSGIYRIVDGKAEKQDPIGAGSIMRAADGKIWTGASGAPTGIRVYELTDGKLRLGQRYTEQGGLLHNV